MDWKMQMIVIKTMQGMIYIYPLPKSYGQVFYGSLKWVLWADLFIRSVQPNCSFNSYYQ